MTQALADKTVLLVEDDPIILRNLARWFQEAGCKVMVAHDGEQGLSQFAKLKPDLVVTDIIMPNREGVETIMAMKGQAPDVKILAISGGGRIGSAELLNLARRLGADAVLPKPFRSAEVLEAARNVLGAEPSVG